jgi:hypothetical protein
MKEGTVRCKGILGYSEAPLRTIATLPTNPKRKYNCIMYKSFWAKGLCMDDFLQVAIDEAKKGRAEGGIPIGSPGFLYKKVGALCCAPRQIQNLTGD